MANGLATKKVDFTREQVATEIKKALPEIERRIGANGFVLMRNALTEILNNHKNIPPKFLGNILLSNKENIEQFYNDKIKEFPKARKTTIYEAVIAAVIVGNLYGIDPLRLLVLIPKESSYNAEAIHKNPNKSKDISLYQINSENNPEKTYLIDPKYELKKFNSTIFALGGFELKKFPRNICSFNILENTVAAALTLIEKMRRVNPKDWKTIYAAYNGSLANPKALSYGVKVDSQYNEEKECYSFVLLAQKGKPEKKGERIAELIPKRLR